MAHFLVAPSHYLNQCSLIINEVLWPSTEGNSVTGLQGWGQFHFFNSIPIPLFSISIPIPLLPISFNSNSNSNSGHFNSNSGEFKSNLNSRNDLFIHVMSSSKLIVIIITRFMYIKSLLLIHVPSVSYPLVNGHNYMALVDPISID